jgi:PAS domain-containing protein
MHLICSYCGKYIKEKKPYEVTRVTHGICPECYVPLLRQNQGLSYDEYLETFDVPVLVVDAARRITAANRAALAMIGRPVERVVGLLGGEAIECLHARLPGGCGRTAHCETCTIKNLVMRTMEQQKSFHNEVVSILTEQGQVDFLVSTLFHAGLVQIVFEASLLHAERERRRVGGNR